MEQLEQALEVSEQDVKDASAGVLKDLKRFQLEKEEDLKRYMVRLWPFAMFVMARLTRCSDCVREVPHGLGKEEPGHMARGEGRGGQDRSAVASPGEFP